MVEGTQAAILANERRIGRATPSRWAEAGRKIKRHWELYLIFLLPLAHLILFQYVPMYGVQIAFRDFTITKGIAGSPWVGFKYFQQFFSAFQFQRVLLNTLSISFLSMALGFPMPILLAQAENLALVAEEITETAWLLAERFWPGGLTLVLPKKASVPDVVSAGGPTVAVRVPDHPAPLALIAALGAPLAATSANLSGRPSPVTAQEVETELGGHIELILDGGRCPGGVPSTVLDLTTDPPTILRVGAIAVEDIKTALAKQRIQLCYSPD